MKNLVRTGLTWSCLTLAVMVVAIIYAWISLPRDEQIPVHWNFAGEADRFAGFAEAMWIVALPAGIAVLTSILLAVIPFVTPRRDNFMKSSSAYLAAWIGSNILIAGVTLLVVWSMLLRSEDTTTIVIRLVLPATCLLMIAVGNYLPKTSANFFVGVRTPWTLSSDYAWTKTHRLTGWLLVLSGLIGLPFAVFGNALWQIMLVVPLILSAMVVSVFYSYMVWRTAPDRT